MFDEKTPEGLEPPRVGDEIYVPTRLHLSRGEDDFVGGLARVADVVIEDLGGTTCYFVEVEEDPGGRYNWSLYIGPAQQELRAQYGEQRARLVPDRRPEYNVPIEHEVPRQRPLAFVATGNAELPYETWFRGEHWEVRINDFPAEELYTLLIDGREVESFSEWPAVWRRPRKEA